MRRFYLSNPNFGVFDIDLKRDQFVDGISLYKFEPFKDNERMAHFSLCDDPRVYQMISENWESYVKPACDYDNEPEKPIDGVETTTKGEAELRPSGNWKVVKKAKIRYTESDAPEWDKAIEKDMPYPNQLPQLKSQQQNKTDSSQKLYKTNYGTFTAAELEKKKLELERQEIERQKQNIELVQNFIKRKGWNDTEAAVWALKHPDYQEGLIDAQMAALKQLQEESENSEDNEKPIAITTPLRLDTKTGVPIFEPTKLPPPAGGLGKSAGGKDNNDSYFKDPRDGNVYRTVKIGRQIWMAENLNYRIKNSWCYDNDEANGKRYGRLYSWSAAKAACPVGWHLPTRQEWDELVTTAGGKMAGKKLKKTEGWYNNDNGTDNYGFSALPGGGGRSSYSLFLDISRSGYWWTATEYDSDVAYRRSMNYKFDLVNERTNDKNLGFSVRCVEDMRRFGK